MGDPTGEADRGALRLDFDRRLMLQIRGSTITSCRRKIEMSPGVQSRDDIPARLGKGTRSASLACIPQ